MSNAEVKLDAMIAGLTTLAVRSEYAGCERRRGRPQSRLQRRRRLA